MDTIYLKMTRSQFFLIWISVWSRLLWGNEKTIVKGSHPQGLPSNAASVSTVKIMLNFRAGSLSAGEMHTISSGEPLQLEAVYESERTTKFHD